MSVVLAKAVSLFCSSIINYLLIILYCLAASEFSEVFYSTLRIFDCSGFDTGRCQTMLDRVSELHFLSMYLYPQGWSVNSFYGTYILNLLSLLVLC